MAEPKKWWEHIRLPPIKTAKQDTTKSAHIGATDSLDVAHEAKMNTLRRTLRQLELADAKEKERAERDAAAKAERERQAKEVKNQ